MFKGTRRKVLTVAVASVGVLAFAGAAWAASTSNSDSFESGGLTNWNATSNATADTTSAKSGVYGVDINSSAATGYIQWSTTAIAQGHAYAVIRAWIKPVSVAATQSLDLISLTNVVGTSNFDFFIAASGGVDAGKFKWDLNSANAATTSYVPTLGQWYLVEAKVFYGATTYTADVRINGVDQTSIASSGLTATTVKSLWLGSSSAKTHQQYFDDVRLDVGDSAFSYLGAPPAIRAACENGETYTVNGTLDNAADTSTTYKFDYGTTTSYGSSTTATADSGAIGENNVSAGLTGLTPGTTYHYRLEATNAAGTTLGPDNSFTTGTRPTGC